jgi:hypothetical protein
MAEIPSGRRVIAFSEEAKKTNAKKVCVYTEALCQGPLTYSLPQAALAIHIFVQDRRKNVDSKQNCV